MKKNIVIASSARKQGKTLLACQIINLIRMRGYTVSAFKLEKCRNGPVEITKGPGRKDSDTCRFDISGSCFSFLVRYSSPDQLDTLLAKIPAKTDFFLWETNSMAKRIGEMFLIYIDGSVSNPKNPDLANIADIVLSGPLKPDKTERAANICLSLLGMPESKSFRVEAKYWINYENQPVLGEGRADLLQAIDEMGSIHKAANSRDIPYKRAWIHINTAEEKLGAKLVISKAGGVHGGGSRLTKLARQLLFLFNQTDSVLRKYIEGEQEL